jgi:hypothetical protein
VLGKATKEACGLDVPVQGSFGCLLIRRKATSSSGWFILESDSGHNQFAITLTSIKHWNRIRTMKLKPFILAAAWAGMAAGFSFVARGQDPKNGLHTFTIGTNDFLLDGQRLQIRCGEIHAARVPKEYWRQRLRM